MRVNLVQRDGFFANQRRRQQVQRLGGALKRGSLGRVQGTRGVDSVRVGADLTRRAVRVRVGDDRARLALLSVGVGHVDVPPGLAVLRLGTPRVCFGTRVGTPCRESCRRLLHRLGVVLELKPEDLRDGFAAEEVEESTQTRVFGFTLGGVEREVQRAIGIEVEVSDERLDRSGGARDCLGGGVAVAERGELGDELGVALGLFSEEVELLLGVHEASVDAHLLLLPPGGARDEPALFEELALAMRQEECAGERVRGRRLAGGRDERLGQIHEARAKVRRELRLERREPDDVREDGRRLGEVQLDAGESDGQIGRVQLLAEHRPTQLQDERLGRARAHAGNRLRGEKHDPDDCV